MRVCVYVLVGNGCIGERGIVCECVCGCMYVGWYGTCACTIARSLQWTQTKCAMLLAPYTKGCAVHNMHECPAAQHRLRVAVQASALGIHTSTLSSMCACHPCNPYTGMRAHTLCVRSFIAHVQLIWGVHSVRPMQHAQMPNPRVNESPTHSLLHPLTGPGWTHHMQRIARKHILWQA